MAKLIDGDKLKKLLENYAAKLEAKTVATLDGAEGEIAGASIEEAKALMAGTIATFQTVVALVDGMPDTGRHGRWDAVKDFSEGDRVTFECSECGGAAARAYGFCPFCGARMDGENDA